MLEAIEEADPGTRLGEFFVEYWPAYARWMRRAEKLPAARCVDELRTHMPELMPIFEELHARLGGGEEEARFLSLYCPPRLVRACSQAVLESAEPVLVRTYDFSPHLFDGLLLHSRWGGVQTLGVTDCLWGAVDGMNAHGLVVALAFGGRNAVGPGFGAPLVARYVLQTCATTDGAVEALKRVPVFMPYTFVVLDSTGNHVTAMVGPDRSPHFERRPASTNHQSEGDWPEYQRQTRSVERLEAIQGALDAATCSRDVLGVFLRPPVWRTDYAHASGTLYAAMYEPCSRAVTLYWPDQSARFSMDHFSEVRLRVTLPAGSALRRSQ